MERRTVIVSGPLAFRMRRLLAARQGDNGLQILTLPLVAARLAGGFQRPATRQDLDPAIRGALGAGDLRELERIRELPGMTRAVAHTLAKAWDADLRLRVLQSQGPRLLDMATIEKRIRDTLPAGALVPPDLRDAALGRISLAPAVLGPVELDRLSFVPPVWRSLFNALTGAVPVRWRNPGTDDLGWFRGEIVRDPPQVAAPIEVVSCADPHSETVEALRWARQLVALGQARPEEIAIVAAKTEPWDDHFLVLAGSGALPIHFSHGVPALSTRDGQACAALADALVNGLSQDRVRRIISHGTGRSRALREMPYTWGLGLRREAELLDVPLWRNALNRAAAERTDGVDVLPLLLPVIELLARGQDAAIEVGDLLLSNPARELWMEALQRAPAAALEFSLRDLRLADERDAGTAVVWGPASHLAVAPRPWVRLIGMTSRAWPRRGGEDPLLPEHIVPAAMLDPDPVAEQDRRAYAVLTRMAAGGCVVSRSRHSAQGTLQAPSPLIPREIPTKLLKRGRIPEHAFSDSDRVQARPNEARSMPAVRSATACWKNWRRPTVTAHDGLIRAGHPIVARALSQTQSATSIRLLLRDPLGFVWRYALGWRSTTQEEQPLGIDPRSFGELVHELLKRAVDNLEPQPGCLKAARHEIEAAQSCAMEVIAAEWPLYRATPPLLLWRHTVEAAARLSLKALTLDESFQPGTRSWTEVRFGDEEAIDITGAGPWDPRLPVAIGDGTLHVRGSIDRLDLNGQGDLRVSDYKTGAEPKQAEKLVLGGGAELQRAIYALACRQLLGSDRRIVARLLFLGDDRPRSIRLDDVDAAIHTLARHTTSARALLKAGTALPGPDAQQRWNEFRLALPAAAGTYFRAKQSAFAGAFGDFSSIWSER